MCALIVKAGVKGKIVSTFLLVESGAGGGTWPPLAAICEQLVSENHTVHMICDDEIAGAFAGLGAAVLTTPADIQMRQILDDAISTEVLPKLERGEPLEGVASPLQAWADAVAPAVTSTAARIAPDAVVGSMFGLPLANALARAIKKPLIAINPGPYVGPNPPRSFEADYPGMIHWWFTCNVLPQLLEADTVIHATDREFDLGFNGLPANHHYVGPLIWDSPGRLPAEFDEPGDPWITASVSTANQAGESDLLNLILEAAQDLQARVLLTAPDHDHSSLARIPSNVVLAKFVPHGAALERSVLMLSHAGHGAVMRAIWMGVPMVLTPWDRDQFAVAYRAQKTGTARVIVRDSLTAARLHDELSAALRDANLRNAARKHRDRLQATNPRRRAVEVVLAHV